MPRAIVEWIGPVSASTDEEQVRRLTGAPPQRKQEGAVNLRFGQLFVDGKKLCSLTHELFGPPDKDGAEVQLRLVGGRCITVNFNDQTSAADSFHSDCCKCWKREAARKGRAASVAKKLEQMSQAAAQSDTDGNRSKSRSRSPGLPAASRKRLLRRLSSVESEGVYRVQHAQDLSQERQQLEESQERLVAFEHIRRKVMPRAEFIESLRKEAAMQAKILELKHAEEEERDRFDALRKEEALLHTSLQEVESDDSPTDVPVADATAPLCSDQVQSVECESSQQPSPVPAPERRDECIICFNALRRTIFLPCKHLVCCERCGYDAAMQKCPMCRSKIDWRFKVFL